MKDEYAGKNIYEVIAIKPKSYTIICENNQEKCTCKGHNANFTSNGYKDVQNNKKILTYEMCDIVSKKHNLFTQKKLKHLHLPMMIKDNLRMMEYTLMHMVIRIF